jgi:hypothetical protein
LGNSNRGRRSVDSGVKLQIDKAYKFLDASTKHDDESVGAVIAVVVPAAGYEGALNESRAPGDAESGGVA